LAFLKAIESKSSDVYLTSIGKSDEGKDIPVAVLARITDVSINTIRIIYVYESKCRRSGWT
jgi:hypothetical protein